MSTPIPIPQAPKKPGQNYKSFYLNAKFTVPHYTLTEYTPSTHLPVRLFQVQVNDKPLIITYRPTVPLDAELRTFGEDQKLGVSLSVDEETYTWTVNFCQMIGDSLKQEFLPHLEGDPSLPVYNNFVTVKIRPTSCYVDGINTYGYGDLELLLKGFHAHTVSVRPQLWYNDEEQKWGVTFTASGIKQVPQTPQSPTPNQMANPKISSYFENCLFTPKEEEPAIPPASEQQINKINTAARLLDPSCFQNLKRSTSNYGWNTTSQQMAKRPDYAKRF